MRVRKGTSGSDAPKLAAFAVPCLDPDQCFRRFTPPPLVRGAQLTGPDRVIDRDAVIRIVVAVDHQLAGLGQQPVAIAGQMAQLQRLARASYLPASASIACSADWSTTRLSVKSTITTDGS